MQQQIAMNILYDLMMQCLRCLGNVHDWIILLICRQMITVVPKRFLIFLVIIICYPCIFLSECHERNLAQNWYGSVEDCLLFHSWNLPFHLGFFHIPYRNFRSIPCPYCRRRITSLDLEPPGDIVSIPTFKMSEFWVVPTVYIFSFFPHSKCQSSEVYQLYIFSFFFFLQDFLCVLLLQNHWI